MSMEIGAEYASSLADLTVNSKPLINMLTILAEENQEHAGVIVAAVEHHLEKVRPEIKLPVLYLVDSIIKNVGGAYTQKFSQIIVSMFTKTFKQVDEKTRSQMFKLRETWNDVFPPNKLYQLDVKVSLVDPAWPIQAQAPLHKPTPAVATAPAIHVNPHFQKKAAVVPATIPPALESPEDMMSVLARKQQELLLLQRQKMELEAVTRRQAAKQETPVDPPAMPAALINPIAEAPAPAVKLPVQQRLGPPVTSRAHVPPGGARIAPVSGAMLATARRADPRLARLQDPPAPSAPDLFDIKPLERTDRFPKRKNAITIDVPTPGKAEERRERDPRRRDPRLKKRPRDGRHGDESAELKLHKKPVNNATKPLHFPIVDPKKVNKLPPIPKISKIKTNSTAEPLPAPSEDVANVSPSKKKDSESPRGKKSRRKDGQVSPASPDKTARNGQREKRPRLNKPIVDVPEPTNKEPEQNTPAETENTEEPEPVAFKELRGSTRDRNYMRRNREKSESPNPPGDLEPATVPEILVDENKDVDLRVLTKPHEPAAVARKRPSTETDVKPAKKNKLEKFDILFGDEDVDLRKLPHMEEAPAPPVISKDNDVSQESPESADDSPKRKSWAKMKDPKKSPEDARSQLDLVRAKLAEATKGKDRLGRPLLFIKDSSERRRTLSGSEDTDMRFNAADMDSDNDRESIKIIMSQAEEQLKGGNLSAEQFNLLVVQVMQLNERQKLKEAKQRESLEVSKRKLHQLSTLASDEETETPAKDAMSFGDIDERILPPRLPMKPDLSDTIPTSRAMPSMDSDLRVPPHQPADGTHPPFSQHSRPILPMPPVFRGGFTSRNGPRPRDDFNPRMRARLPAPAPFFRGRMPFDRLPLPPQPRMPPPPMLGMSQGECPLAPYVRSTSPPPLGTTDLVVPPTDFKLVEYIERDPMKSIDIDGVPREIRFYGRTAIVMMDWDDPREITFLPGRRRITFDGKDSFFLNFNEDDVKVNVDGNLLKVGYGKPTRELYVEDKWYECFFGGPPAGIFVENKIMVVHLAGPPPQVDIGKEKRCEFVAGKINLIIDAVYMCPLFLDAKPQKVEFDGTVLTIRFVDSLHTVMINEKPFKVEYGGLPKPIIVNKNKHFIRFSVLPRNIRPGHVTIVNMEGKQPAPLTLTFPTNTAGEEESAVKHDSNDEGENNNQGGLDMLASLMPSTMAPASQFSGYSVAEPLKPAAHPGQIPGLDTPQEETPPQTGGVPFLGSINVNDLFAKLVATGIVQPSAKPEEKEEEKKEEIKPVEKPQIAQKQDRKINRVDLLKPETLRVKQSGMVSLLYSGMQCSGCGARFPPEQTVRYSQHLDWHFRQNRRERDSARRAHSRNWHYDLSDWIQYEEVEDLEEREKSWFESQGAHADGQEPTEPAGAGAEHEAPSVAAGAPADAACALCGDKFNQFYNQDKEEWHLRKAVRHDDKNYHPLCFEDYKASLTKAETPLDDSVVVVTETLPPPGADEDVEEVVGSDEESVVEVLECESQDEQVAPTLIEDDPPEAPVESDGDDDDVVLKTDPVEQVDVEDDDTDDETSAARARRDHDFDIANVKIKQEPIDPDDEPIVTAESEPVVTRVDTTLAGVTSSIDGNVQLESSVASVAVPAGGIRINITKPIALPVSPPSEDNMAADDCDEPLPPGEEPVIEYTLKPTLEGVEFSRQIPVERGIELSGLCSIM